MFPTPSPHHPHTDSLIACSGREILTTVRRIADIADRPGVRKFLKGHDTVVTDRQTVSRITLDVSHQGSWQAGPTAQRADCTVDLAETPDHGAPTGSRSRWLGRTRNPRAPGRSISSSRPQSPPARQFSPEAGTRNSRPVHLHVELSAFREPAGNDRALAIAVRACTSKCSRRCETTTAYGPRPKALTIWDVERVPPLGWNLASSEPAPRCHSAAYTLDCNAHGAHFVNDEQQRWRRGHGWLACAYHQKSAA